MALKRRKTRGANQAKVLVVDPRGEDLEHTSRVLREGGLRVVSLSRLEASGPVYGVFAPDLVVLSVSASDLSALKIGQRLRHLSRGTLPILYLADSTDAALRRACLEKGRGFDALAKPADPPELLAKVNALLELKECLSRAQHGEHKAPTLHDPLTGVYNRRMMLAAIGQEIRRAERYGGDFSVVACELKGFQPFRHEFGREMADRLLVYASMVLSQTVRESDLVAKTGEEQFAILLPGTPAEQLSPLLERIAARFELARFQFDGKTVRISMGLGQASFPDVVGTPARLLEAAALDAKRGQVISRLGTSTRLAL